MLEAITTVAVCGAVIAPVIGLAYMCDHALMRRRHRRGPDTIILHPHNNDAYSFAPSRTEEQLVMCGGCGHCIAPGACPGPDNCKHFSPKSILAVD